MPRNKAAEGNLLGNLGLAYIALGDARKASVLRVILAPLWLKALLRRRLGADDRSDG